MIIVISKIQVRRGLESELSTLDVGELAMTTDTGRLFVGHDPSVGNPNFNRTDFPGPNVEVLTENSPRVGELFSQNVRDQDRNDFFFPVSQADTGGNYQPLTFLEYEGGIPTPAWFWGQSVSATVEYHVFDSADMPIKQGTLRLMGKSSSHDCYDDGVGSGAAQVTFQLGPQSFDTDNAYFELQVKNSTGGNVTILIRKVSITGLSAAPTP